VQHIIEAQSILTSNNRNSARVVYFVRTRTRTYILFCENTGTDDLFLK